MATPRMGDGNIVRELKRWATEEFNLPPQSLPHDSYLKTLCVGKGSSIWKYVMQHVFQQRKVKIIRGNLQWYKGVQSKELKQAEGQSEAVKRRELQEKIEHLRAEISHLDTQISGAEDQLATEERSISRTWDQVEGSQRRELLLQAFRQHCSVGHQALREDACKIRRQCQNVDQLARKAEVDVLFENEPSSSSGGIQPNFTMATVPQILREVRDLCDERVLFFQSLQESEQKTAPSAASHMPREQRAAMFKYWLSAVEDLLCGYPPNQVLSALQYLAFRQQRDMEEKLSSLDVTQDVTALRFRYESNHLLDISREEEKELPPVKHLLQCAWEVVEQSHVELNQTRSRVQQLHSELQARKEDSMQEVSLKGNDLHNDTLALSVLELELQCVMQAATRDHIGEQCLHLNQEVKNQQQALRNLHNQWKSILDFRQLVDVRQEQIRGLIKGNSSAKTELIRLHRELVQFVQGKLVPQFGEVITATNVLRNSVSQEARHFGTVSLSSLDRRTVEGVQRIPASWLSIHRLQSSCFNNFCQSLAFPLYRAPEELYSQTRSQLLELCFLRHLLQLHTTTLQKVQQQRELLHEPDQKAFLSRVVEEDQKLLKSLIPRVRQLSKHVAQGQSYGKQVKTAVSHWWDQPAQHALPEINKGGLTFQQWLQRWKQAAKTS